MGKIYLTIRYGRGNILRGYILDISRGGMGIACSKRISKNTIIEILTEKNILFPMKGKVVSALYRQWEPRYKYRLAIKFISAEGEKKERLDRFIRKMERRKVARFTLTYIWKHGEPPV